MSEPASGSVADYRRDLAILARSIGRELWTLERAPEYLSSHLHNVLWRELDDDRADSDLLRNARASLATRAWLRLTNHPRARSTLLLTLSCPAQAFSVAWSPDGSVIAAGAADGSVRLWEPDSGNPLEEFEQHQGQVRLLAWSPDGRFLASGGADGAVRLWDRHERTTRDRMWHSAGVGALAWAPDGTRLASGGEDGRLPIWHVDGEQPVDTLDREHSPVNGLAWSPDGAYLAVGTEAGALRAWNLADKRVADMPSPHGRGIYSVAWSPDGSMVASGGEDGSVVVYGRGTWQPSVLPGGHRGAVDAVAWSPDGIVLASAGSGSDRTVKLWDPLARSQLSTLAEGHTETIFSLAWSPEGGVIASAGMEGAILIREVPAPGDRTVPDGHVERVLSISWSPDLHSFCSGDSGISHIDIGKGARTVSAASVRLWETATGGARPGTREGSEPMWPVAWSSDGVTLAWANGAVVHRWNMDRGRVEDSVKTGGGREPSSHRGRNAPIPRALIFDAAVTALAWSPDGSALAAGKEDGSVWLCGDRRAKRFRGEHSDCVWSLTWAPGGDLLASGSWDGTAAVWDVRSKRRVDLLPPQAPGATMAVAWRPAGGEIAVAGQAGVLWLWSPSTNAVRMLTRPMHPIWALAWSPDGTMLGLGCGDRTVRVLDVERNEEVRATCLSPILAVAFDAHGRTVSAVDGGDSTANRPIPYVFELDGL